MPTPLRSDDRDPRVPALSIVFGFGPMIPIMLAAAALWLAPAPWKIVATRLGVLWSAAVLLLLAGVRRGLSFRTPGGERPVQLLTMGWLFALGLLALLLPTAVAALAMLILGYASIAVLDPIAARRDEVPAHFGRLRPVQMTLAIVALAAMLAWHLLMRLPAPPS